MQIQIFICKKTWCKKVVIFYVESCYKNSIYFHIYYICVVSEIKRNVLIIWFIFLPSILSWVKRFYLLNTIHFVCFFKLHCLWLAFILPLIAVLYKWCLLVFIYNACINSTIYIYSPFVMVALHCQRVTSKTCTVWLRQSRFVS